MSKQFLIVFFVSIVSFHSLFAQRKYIIKNPRMLKIVAQGVDKMYNYEFDAAEELFQKIYKSYPKHPVTPFLKGMLVHWQNAPLTVTSEEFKIFEQKMKQTSEFSEVFLDENEDDLEGVFFDMSAREILLQVYNDNDEVSKVMGDLRTIYKHVKKGFKLQQEFKEFYFTVGLYNYYREMYPKKNPIYAPLMFFFKSGDQQEGLRQLNYAGEHCIFLRGEALNFLNHIYLTFEENPTVALSFTQKLLKLYPNNTLFIAKHLETLVIAKRYRETKPYFEKLLADNQSNDFSLFIGQIYKGIYEEKTVKNYQEAQKWYLKSVESAKKYEVRGHEFLVYSYTGLERTYKILGNKELAKKYHKQAKDIAQYDYMLEK